jgi:hypothetical protein
MGNISFDHFRPVESTANVNHYDTALAGRLGFIYFGIAGRVNPKIAMLLELSTPKKISSHLLCTGNLSTFSALCRQSILHGVYRLS